MRSPYEIVIQTRGRKSATSSKQWDRKTGGGKVVRQWMWHAYRSKENKRASSRTPWSGSSPVLSLLDSLGRRTSYLSLVSLLCPPRSSSSSHGGAVGPSPAAGLGGDPNVRSQPSGPAATCATAEGGRTGGEKFADGRAAATDEHCGGNWVEQQQQHRLHKHHQHQRQRRRHHRHLQPSSEECNSCCCQRGRKPGPPATWARWTRVESSGAPRYGP